MNIFIQFFNKKNNLYLDCKFNINYYLNPNLVKDFRGKYPYSI